MSTEEDRRDSAEQADMGRQSSAHRFRDVYSVRVRTSNDGIWHLHARIVSSRCFLIHIRIFMERGALYKDRFLV